MKKTMKLSDYGDEMNCFQFKMTRRGISLIWMLTREIYPLM